MEIIDFNSSSFKGFKNEEDIVVDTGVFLGYYNEYDAYYTTVNKWFENHILNNDISMYLYVNPTTINEFTHLSNSPLKQYLEAHPEKKSDF